MQLPATWSATAPGYGEEVMPHMARYAEKALQLVPVSANDRVLDIAAGPGSLTFVAALRGARVHAIDFAPGMLEELRARSAQQGAAQIETSVMDAQALTFPDASFDAAFCMFGYMFFPDRAQAFREMRRVLRPEGRALVATWAAIDRRPFMKLGFEAMAEALPQLPAPTKGDLQTTAECVEEMTAAGFRNVTAQTFSADARIDSPEHYLRIMARSGAPFVALKKKLGDEAWAQAEARMLEALRKRIPENGVMLGAEAILAAGQR
jgi:ubiquinone/menaquinone biosynthesis C-methylase UbiE